MTYFYPMEEERQKARQAGLIYADPDLPGYRRKRWGRGFLYHDPEGERVTDPEKLKRFKALVIPPAWKEVWIFPEARGHIQATGRDAKGRKQYIYHPRWQEISNLTKFDRLLDFGSALPEIRQQVEKDLRKRSWTRRKVAALAVRLLDDTLIRIGNSEYEKENRSFGLTTLNQDHVEVEGNVIRISFRGKSGKERQVDIRDRRLARLVKKCEELPGQKLFQYRDEDGELQTLESDDVNDYLQSLTGEDFTAKDFRTWGATVLAVEVLSELEVPETAARCRRVISSGVKEVAGKLGNTPSICRKYYIHPRVVEAFEDDRIKDLVTQTENPEMIDAELTRFEQAVLHLLNGGPRAGEQADTSRSKEAYEGT